MIFKLIENNAEQRRGVRRRARTTDTTEELGEHCIYHLYFAYIQHVVMKTCGLAFLIFSVVLSTCTKACAKDLVHRTGKKNGLTVLEHFNPVINIIKVCR
ncbi:hypothetical protein AST19_19170 [Acinetobacter baumannii]|nr:hypothetical protein AST20_19290 [Acinetobacter baumannii]OUM76855.1 hypothetical protein AST19_19170 [Acinetobacter baumannii]TPT90013.1 hypothetical protein FJU53_19385 [Acinetobacter baumannii]